MKQYRVFHLALGFVLLGLATTGAAPAQAANRYVRAGATGLSDGSDWTNAYPSLPGSLTRGDTYYIGDGGYAGRAFNTAVSGTTLITIKKATIADHGTNTGWSDTYGDGQAAFASELLFTTSYWVLDGQVGGGPSSSASGTASWKSGFGFKVTETRSLPVIFVQNAGNITVRHVETQGAGDNGAPGGTGNDSFQMYGATGPVTLSYAYLHDSGRCHFYVHSTSGQTLTAEYVYTAKMESVYNGEHAETAVIHRSANLVLRWSIVTHEEGTGGIIGGDDALNVVAEIYGNVFYNTGEFAWGIENNGLFATDSAGVSANWKVYNNTFINLPSALTTFGSYGSQSGHVASNNYFYNTTNHSANGWGTQSYDHFQSSGAASGSNGTTGSGDPFVNYAGYDFRLKTATQAGRTLSAPYNIDMYGNTRGADGTWDRGAVEFGNTSTTYPPAAATNVRVIR